MFKKQPKTYAKGVGILILINLVTFFFIQKNMQITVENSSQFFLIPRLYLGGYTSKFVLLTSLFIHANLYHLLGNLMVLWLFGEGVESELNPFLFICLYLCFGIISNVLALLYYSDSMIPIVGSSGAVSAIMASHLVLHYNRRVNIKSIVSLSRSIIYVGVIFWFFIQLVFSFIRQSDGVWVIHANAFLLGVISMFFIRYFFLDSHHSV